MESEGYGSINWREFFLSKYWPNGRTFTKAEAIVDLFMIGSEIWIVADNRMRPGEVKGSMGFLSKRWNWPKSTTHRFLKSLEEDEQLRGIFG